MRVYQLDQIEQSQDGPKGTESGRNKKGFWTPVILQDRTMELLGMLYPSRKEKNDPEGDSEMSGLPFLPSTCVEHTGLEGKALSWFQRVSLPPGFWEPGCPDLEPQGAGLQQKATAAGLLPRAPGMTLMPQLRGRQSIQPED